MNGMWIIVILMAISISFEGVGDYFLKKWSIGVNKNFLFLSLFSYNAMLITWMSIVLRTKEISIVGTIWLLLGHMCLIFVGAGIFQEPLTIKQWIGIGLAVISLILLSS